MARVMFSLVRALASRRPRRAARAKDLQYGSGTEGFRDLLMLACFATPAKGGQARGPTRRRPARAVIPKGSRWCSCTGARPGVELQAAPLLRSRGLPHRPLRPARLREEHPPRLAGGEHQLGPGRRHGAAANRAGHRALASLRAAASTVWARTSRRRGAGPPGRRVPRSPGTSAWARALRAGRSPPGGASCLPQSGRTDERLDAARVVLALAADIGQADEAACGHVTLPVASTISTAPMRSPQVASRRPKASSSKILSLAVLSSRSQPSGRRFSKNGWRPRRSNGSGRLAQDGQDPVHHVHAERGLAALQVPDGARADPGQLREGALREAGRLAPLADEKCECVGLPIRRVSDLTPPSGFAPPAPGWPPRPPRLPWRPAPGGPAGPGPWRAGPRGSAAARAPRP